MERMTFRTAWTSASVMAVFVRILSFARISTAAFIP